MRTLLKILSFVGLLLTIVPSILVVSGVFEKETHYSWTFAGTVLWFATAPFWINRQKAGS